MPIHVKMVADMWQQLGVLLWFLFFFEGSDYNVHMFITLKHTARSLVRNHSSVNAC